MAVVRGVSAVDGHPPEQLPPLGKCLDTDALNSVFAESPDGTPPTTKQLSFVYNEYHITVVDGEYIYFTENRGESPMLQRAEDVKQVSSETRSEDTC